VSGLRLREPLLHGPNHAPAKILLGLPRQRTSISFLHARTIANLQLNVIYIMLRLVIRRVGISEQTFYRWKKHYSGLEVDQVRQLKQLQDENGRLKKLVAELSLDRAMLQDVLRKNW